MDVSGVTDSTDWLSTPLACLAPLESSLRCQVCKEILTTPMITSCSHTFCSLCIRRYLSQEGKCPSCREPDQEMKLRHNYAVEELVGIWSEKRAEIYTYANAVPSRQEQQEVEEQRPKKRRRVAGGAVVVQKSGLEERRSTRSQSRRGGSQASQPLPSTQEEVADSEAGSQYQESPESGAKHPPSHAAKPHDGLVGCPTCSRRMREASINAHLDKCLQGLASPSPPPQPGRGAHASSPQPHVQAGTIAYTQSKPAGTAKQRLPTINYSLLTENSLRRKLKDLGIPNLGSKELMRRRHGEWVNLWNANCDSLQPLSKGKLLRDLDVWERNLGKDERQRQAAGGPNGGGAVMEKEFDREGYMRREKDDFLDLIRQARESRSAKQTADAPPAPAGSNHPADDAGAPKSSPPTAADVQMADTGSSCADSAPIGDQTAAAAAAYYEPPPAPPPAGGTETLVPNTPPRPQQAVTNGYHAAPTSALPPPLPIDLISRSPSKRESEQHEQQLYSGVAPSQTQQ